MRWEKPKAVKLDLEKLQRLHTDIFKNEGNVDVTFILIY
jgi:hypothetical protein